VTLLLSTGVEQVAVPDVKGKSFEEASSQLQAKGFQVQRNDQVTDSADPGTVVKQDPGAGSKIDKGSTVTLAVAKEPQQVDVPDVTGETQADAVTRLSKQGFEIRTREQPVDSQEGDGVVLEQNPAAGRAKRGSTVTITVGKFDPSLAPGQTTPAPATPPATPPATTPATP
jgi:serine/threonine-protein kinase